MNRRTNIDKFRLKVRGKPDPTDVFVYEDHRTILNVLDHRRRHAHLTSR